MHTITLVVDNTTYYLNSTTDPLELTKRARKAYKPKKPKDIRKFPVWVDSMSTAAYIRAFDKLNMLQAVDYIGANENGTAVYDTSIPLFEILPDEVSQ
jgi:hypothetical protein